MISQGEVPLVQPVAERHPPNCQQVIQRRHVGSARVRHPPLSADAIHLYSCSRRQRNRNKPTPTHQPGASLHLWLCKGNESVKRRYTEVLFTCRLQAFGQLNHHCCGILTGIRAGQGYTLI